LFGGTILETHRITRNLESTKHLGADQQLPQGTVLEGRYFIEGVIGIGGMGAVYHARDLRFRVEKRVAVKEMVNQARDALVRETIVQNFEREANILATLNHSSIPKIHDYFTIEDRSYLVMEYIEGNNLETILNQTQGFISEAQIINWALALCEVLHYLHTHEPQPIVFRDMKPSNVVITPSNQIVLVDFGIAKTFQADQKGTMIGTEGYSPPEQYRGEATPRVDIYALGATLHHLLTRKDPRIEPPFTFAERPIRETNPAVSMELELVVNTALQYNATDRFESAADLKQALLAVAQKTGVLTSTGLPTTATITQSHNIQPLWTFECEDEIRGSATYSSGMIYVGCYDNNLYAINAATGEFLWKYATDGGIVSKPVVFDNNIFFGSEDYRVHVISPRRGNVIWTYYTDGPVRSSPTLQDRHVFIGSDDSHLHVINAMSGRQVMKFNAGAPIRSTPLVNNDVVYFGTESGDFFCIDFQGRLKWQARAKRAITSSPIIRDDVVYYGSLDSMLYAVEAKTGWGIWRYRLKKGTISTPWVSDELLFTGAIDNRIYCIDIRMRKEAWSFETGHQVTGSPIIYKDSLYCGSVDGCIYCIEYRSGRLRWKYKTGGPITSTPIIHEDIVYIGSTDHLIYALPT
jgi:outer membrane protein assembly factor BamB/tRNA A-37 threonylcarbamoyl transferase component Bud32